MGDDLQWLLSIQRLWWPPTSAGRDHRTGVGSSVCPGEGLVATHMIQMHVLMMNRTGAVLSLRIAAMTLGAEAANPVSTTSTPLFADLHRAVAARARTIRRRSLVLAVLGLVAGQSPDWPPKARATLLTRRQDLNAPSRFSPIQNRHRCAVLDCSPGPCCRNRGKRCGISHGMRVGFGHFNWYSG